MLHLDVKKLGKVKGLGHRITGHQSRLLRNRGIGWDFVHVCVDDATRVAYVEVLADELGTTTAGFLQRALGYYRELGIRTASKPLISAVSTVLTADFAGATPFKS